MTFFADFETFGFNSVGSQGGIYKVVRYDKISDTGEYNLSFGDLGDLDKQTGLVSDVSVSGNQDQQGVLATVAATLYGFFSQHPNAAVYAVGSTAARTRLYRMGIARNLAEITRDFDVHGLTERGWQPFRANTPYLAFKV